MGHLFRLWARKSFQYNLIQSAHIYIPIWFEGCCTYISLYLNWWIPQAVPRPLPTPRPWIHFWIASSAWAQFNHFFSGEAAQWLEIWPWQPRYFAHCKPAQIKSPKGNKVPLYLERFNNSNHFILFSLKSTKRPYFNIIGNKIIIETNLKV